MEEIEAQATSSQAEGLLKIAPPRLEDAGLEDCALPPDAIKLAFLKAADAIGSVLPGRLRHREDDDGYSGKRCVDNPPPTDGGLPDYLLGAPSADEERHRGPCSGKDIIPAAIGDDVVVGRGKGWEGSGDRVLGLNVRSSEDDGPACVDGLEGLDEVQQQEDQQREKRDERPILDEAYI
ncbi:uncharacterized protein LOC116254053 [Nymphaea colorata]|uniref:uncharacterized protein LOC116254053 n=1 Tax=Nymphaea colorata TaxID=210225 RepID=UPI00129E8873|nr:uncharacterized protein LOC116254053 [Nymphaea colorata]